MELRSSARAKAAGRKGALHLSHNHLESNPPHPTQPHSPFPPVVAVAVLPGKIAYLHGAAFASKSLGGDVNNDRATCTYGFSSSRFARFPDSLSPSTFNVPLFSLFLVSFSP